MICKNKLSFYRNLSFAFISFHFKIFSHSCPSTGKDISVQKHSILLQIHFCFTLKITAPKRNHWIWQILYLFFPEVYTLSICSARILLLATWASKGMPVVSLARNACHKVTFSICVSAHPHGVFLFNRKSEGISY